MQTKSGLKRITMNKGSDKTFTELHEAYIKKCKVNNLSEYTINFYKVSVRTFGKFVDIDQCLNVVKIVDGNSISTIGINKTERKGQN